MCAAPVGDYLEENPTNLRRRGRAGSCTSQRARWPGDGRNRAPHDLGEPPVDAGRGSHRIAKLAGANDTLDQTPAPRRRTRLPRRPRANNVALCSSRASHRRRGREPRSGRRAVTPFARNVLTIRSRCAPSTEPSDLGALAAAAERELSTDERDQALVFPG
jgi:hypothetical protein